MGDRFNNKRRIVHAQRSKEPKKNQRQPSSFRNDCDGDCNDALVDCSVPESTDEDVDEDEDVDDLDT